MKATKKKSLPHTQVSSLGGQATKSKMPKNYYSEIAKKRWAKVKAK